MVTRRRFLQAAFVVPLAGLADTAFGYTELQLSRAKGEGGALKPRPPSNLRWDAGLYGNHRYTVDVVNPALAVRVTIPWRRRDRRPEQVAVLVVDPDGKQVTNVARGHIDQVEGVLVFEARHAGVYSVYYLPYTTSGNPNYPTVTYLGPTLTADVAWLKRSGTDDVSRAANLPEAHVLFYQGVDDFDAFTSMERIAAPVETRKLLEANLDLPWLLFPETRVNPVRMFHQLPVRWADRGAGGQLKADALRGEYLSFQVGLWTARAKASNVRVQFDDLRGPGGTGIPSSRFSCFNLAGIDHHAQPFTARLDVPRGNVQPLWMGVDVPEDATPGVYHGTLTISADSAPPQQVPLAVTVGAGRAVGHGDDDPFRLTRLRWLNSTLAQDNKLVKPFTAVTVHGARLDILGRSVTLAPSGLPRQIRSYFNERMTGMAETPRELLAAPIRLLVEDASGTHGLAAPGTPHVRADADSPGKAQWNVEGQAGPLAAKLSASLEMDGTLKFVIALTAPREAAIRDIRLEIPLASDVAEYGLGLGRIGSPTPADFAWKWNVENHQDGAWIGTVNAGLEFHLRDEHYRRPLNTNFYHSQPLLMPTSWDNGGRGGITFKREHARYSVKAYSGARTLAAGQTLYYNLVLRVTPFKPIKPARHFADRYFQGYGNLDVLKADGVSVVNVHQGTPINPWINYPFLDAEKMAAYVDAAHARDMQVKLYYTIRELSDRAPELPMLESLRGCREPASDGDSGACSEIISPGKGGGYSWLQEHLDGDYIQGWHTLGNRDSAVVDSGQSRWNNYYIEGLDWLARKIHIDGLYVDDCGYGRTTMRRARKVLDAHREHPLIDLHSANQFDPRDGWINSALLYMELFPYIDRLWFGEEFDYDHTSPAYWLTEVSGIPYGLMGGMLQGGGNPWRGMLFGMTTRIGDPRTADPRPLWKLWDAFGIERADMIGWWVKDSPVTTNNKNVLATSYVRKGSSTMVALASWAPTPSTVKLDIDWKALGLDPAQTRIVAPPVEDFQPASEFQQDGVVHVEPGRGWLLVLQ